jgi:recombination protein RecR
MYEGIVQDLIDEFGKLPGVGPKSAQRIAFFIIQNQGYDPTKLSELWRQSGRRSGSVTSAE